METTIGKRIATLRREKNLRQDDLAERLLVSPQAVSKWENDQTCPDISLLPKLAEILGVTVDELLSGKKETKPEVQFSEEKRKEIKDRILRILVDTNDGNKVRVNLPMTLVQSLLDAGIAMPEISGNITLKGIDWAQILDMARRGAIGNLVEVESAEGVTVRIFVE